VLGATTFNTIPSAQSVFTIGQRVGVDFAENYMFMGNGGAGPYKYDGLVFTQHGVSAPAATCSVASATTGSLTTAGQYVYKITHVNTALVESNLGPASTTFVVTTAGGGLSTTLTSIPVGSAPSNGVNSRYIYRTLSGGSTYYRVAKLLDNTTTTYTDTTSDTALSAGVPAPTDNGLPPLYNAIIYHRNILFVNDATNPNYVWYSVIGQPYTFPSTNYFKVGDKTGDLVKGFASYDNYIVIFCEGSTWINYMPDPATPTTWRQIKSNSPYGSKSPYCMINCNVMGQDMLIHAAIQNKVFVGFGGLTGTTLDPAISYQAITSVGSDLKSQVIEPDMFQVQSTYLNNISGIVYKNRAFITVTYGTGQLTNNRIYVWDFSMSNLNKKQIASWAPWTGVNVKQFTIYGGQLYGCSSLTDGNVYQISNTGVYSDNGRAINSYIWTKEHGGWKEDLQTTKDFRYVNILYDNAGAYFMNMIYRVDSDEGQGNKTTIDLDPGGDLWGGFQWGLGEWGVGNSQTDARIYLGPLRGKRIQIQFNNQNKVNQRFKIHRGQIAYNLKGYR
jgi:hypothetical protein